MTDSYDERKGKKISPTIGKYVFSGAKNGVEKIN
jgi:hypothetical protein